MLKITNYFEEYLEKESLFLEKQVLSTSYIPNEIIHREEQLQEVANILAPALKLEKPSNFFIYGKTGTGKTLSVKYIQQSMTEIARKKNIPLKFIYLNCKMKKIADTGYRLIAQLIKEYGQEVPATGLPTDEIYNIFYNLLDKKEQLLLLILDEIDQLTKKTGDELLYNLTRINAELKKNQISIIGISNNLNFTENLDPRVKSSLSEEELVFPPYNALQIQDILQKRAIKAFKPGVVQDGAIEKCAAYAAREHGDARRAIDLLRVAGEIAERNNSQAVEISHLDEAEKKIEADKITITSTNQPKQFQLIFYVILLFSPPKRIIYTGEIYDAYETLCKKYKWNILTQRRVSDILAELDMLGMIRAKIISKGRYGRTREISLSLDESMVSKLKEILEKSLQLN